MKVWMSSRRGFAASRRDGRVGTRPSVPTSPRAKAVERWLWRLCLLWPLALLLVFFALPMLAIAWHSLIDDATGTIGASNYAAVLRAPRVWHAAWNSAVLGVTATAFALMLGFVLAYGIERTAMRGKRLVTAAMALPVLAPSLVLGLGLIFLLGRNGIVGRLTGTRPDIYGFWGLVLADVLYALPEAVLILRAALRRGDASQHEAAQLLGAGAWRRFLDVTMPGARYGLGRAAFVVFTVTITDFGNAVVIGGDYPLLATELYNQVSGQMHLGMGAVVGMLLLLPAALCVLADRRLERIPAGSHADARHHSAPVPECARDLCFSAATLSIAAAIAVVIGTVVLASFVQLWPYRFDWTLRHYALVLADGLGSLWFSVKVSAVAAAVGTVGIFSLAYGMRRATGGYATLAGFLVAAPVTVPGLVLGLGYLFAFNAPVLSLGTLYGSAALLVCCNIVHYYTQGHAMVATGLRFVPAALEDAVTVLGGGTGAALRDVYLPALSATLGGLAAFLFMRSMVTLSAVIFLVTPDLPLAAVAVMRLDEAGFTAQAAAFSTCIMVTVAASLIVFHGCSARAMRARRPR
ncbi:ABC transporter permease subunit [Chitinasiproducens palmae]|uniref:Iron(III) transport system permease protein n=1 Tax=Chitinasiproducens palmae TaxID=1770053 RepID=A0A1H2PLQ9_9BURK|nr:ABC transporter permease subunit [Chitinasiproducens palmae]SDV47348.1 iron(III) transport system permease protein [Chitinasiproducens palmae]